MQTENKQNQEQGKPPSLIFSLMVLTNILINLDHGILPACTSELQDTYGMDEAQLGILGSIVYLGISLMGLFAGRLYQHFNSKLLTIMALIMLEFSLLLFVLSTHKATAYLSRFATGVCQVFLLVYYPIWIDKFGLQKKTMWLTLLQICVPLGIFMGYGMTAVIISLGGHHTLSFYIQIGVVAVFIIAFVFLGNGKLDSRRNESESINDNLIRQKQPKVQSENKTEKEKEQAIKAKHQQKNKYKFFFMIRKLFRSKMYLVGTFTMAVILYVSTGIQFWLTKYYVDVLGFKQSDVYVAYAVVSLTGPTTGCAFGGYVISKIGGYDHPHTVYYVFAFSSIGIGSALFIPFVDNFYALAVLLWIVLFFGGAMMPGLTGLMMSSVSPYLRAFGNSTGQIIKNLFGYLPSPFVYGLFNTLFGNRAGIKFLMFWGLWAPILLLYGSIHKYRHIKKIKQQVKSAKKNETVAEQVYSDAQETDQKEECDKKEVEDDKKSPDQQNSSLSFGLNLNPVLMLSDDKQVIENLSSIS